MIPFPVMHWIDLETIGGFQSNVKLTQRHLAVCRGLDQDVVVEAVVIEEITEDHTMVEEEMATVVGAVGEDGRSCRSVHTLEA